MGSVRGLWGRDKFFYCRNKNKTYVGFNFFVGILFNKLRGG